VRTGLRNLTETGFGLTASDLLDTACVEVGREYFVGSVVGCNGPTDQISQQRLLTL